MPDLSGEAKGVDQFITFNGRNFDVPFLMMRSAMVGVKVTKNLMGYRYGDEHIDLLEQFTFYGLTRKFNLDFYCQSFGMNLQNQRYIRMEVKIYSRQNKDIAVYCSKDIYATYQCFRFGKNI
jgi:predicted PolB exonuclease-like 3'-5' exonuclease